MYRFLCCLNVCINMRGGDDCARLFLMIVSVNRYIVINRLTFYENVIELSIHTKIFHTIVVNKQIFNK